MSTTLTFSQETRDWSLSNPAWDHAVKFLTHDSAWEYAKRNRIAIDSDSSKVWQGGEKVVINHINEISAKAKYEGLTGTVEFEYDTLVYVFVRTKGQRKDRSITVHRDSLSLAH